MSKHLNVFRVVFFFFCLKSKPWLMIIVIPNNVKQTNTTIWVRSGRKTDSRCKVPVENVLNDLLASLPTVKEGDQSKGLVWRTIKEPPTKTTTNNQNNIKQVYNIVIIRDVNTWRWTLQWKEKETHTTGWSMPLEILRPKKERRKKLVKTSCSENFNHALYSYHK